MEADLLERLHDAQRQHISDLRVLLDKAESRERELAQMVRMVMEDRFSRRVITTGRAPSPASSPIAAEHLSDVTQFDHEADAAQIAEHDKQTEQIAGEFNAILEEHNEFRAGRGMQPVQVSDLPLKPSS